MKAIVRHRVNEILKLTDKEDWAYCSTEENPAGLGQQQRLFRSAIYIDSVVTLGHAFPYMDFVLSWP